MPQIVVTGQPICATQDESRAVREYLPDHIQKTRAEPGCLFSDVVITEDPLVWQVDERFIDAEAFQAHQRRAASSQWGRATAGITRRYTVRED